MESFSQFLLTEAQFNISKFEKVLKLFETVLERRIGKIYRYGGEDGFVNLRGASGGGFQGIGFLYLYKESSAFRINYVKQGASFGFDSIDIWNKFSIKNLMTSIKPNFQVNIPEGTNIIKIIDIIAGILKNPREGAKVFINESAQPDFLVEAKKVSFPEFLSYVTKDHGDISNLSLKQLKDTATRYNIGLPGVIWGMRAGRGQFDLTKSPADAEQSTGVSKDIIHAKSTDLVLISRSDTDGRFYKMEPKTAPQEELIKAQTVINSVLSARKSDPNEEFNTAHAKFEAMEELVKMVSMGFANSLVITGGPGIGKTFTVVKTVKGCGLYEKEDFIVVKGKSTAAALYRTLFMNPDKLLLFDDTDSVFKDSDAVNILKAGLDSYPIRQISWMSGQTVNVSRMLPDEVEDFANNVRHQLDLDPEDNKIKLPSEFNFTGRIIFISNLDENKLDSAVLNRGPKIFMNLTQEEIFERMRYVSAFVGPSEMSIEDKYEVLEEMKKLVGSKEVSIRTYSIALGFRASGNPMWKKLIRFV